MGTAVGSKVFTEHGWRADAALNLAFTGFTLVVLFLRGPHCPRYTWIGWQGGFELRKSRVVARQEREHAHQEFSPGLLSTIVALLVLLLLCIAIVFAFWVIIYMDIEYYTLYFDH